MMKRELDRVTLEACRRGDGRAFRALVECYQDRVYALCAALAGSDGEDIAQEVFVRVHGAIARFAADGEAALSTWILTIARRACIDLARARRPAGPATDDERVDASTPEAELAARRLDDKVRRALAALPDEQRAALVLREWDGLEYDEIAAVENVPVGTVRSRLARARQALREALAVELGAGEEHHVGRD